MGSLAQIPIKETSSQSQDAWKLLTFSEGGNLYDRRKTCWRNFHKTRKIDIRELEKDVFADFLYIEAVVDASIMQFGPIEKVGLALPHNDALMIIVVMANYEVSWVFIDSRSSTGIIFGKAYDQMQLGDIPIELVDTSVFGFVREMVHHRGTMILPLFLGEEPLTGIRLIKCFVVDISFAYNVILGRPLLIPFEQ
ncbi:UNVERIFIED_CONTAM: hypothetical protein Sradi_1884500 [Sesamum radiatum]|uniref:Uncharacterized protein n=1 Tax=Sesamum radiatum TaxID=300843 RepID=A0AAW2U111_SESRA